MTSRAFTSVALAAVALFSAGPALAASTDKVTAALYGEPDSLDPIYDTNIPALNIYYAIFDRLATIDAKGDIVPNLATAWKSNADQTEWTFDLEKGAKCHDGNPMDGSDVVFTYKTAMTEPTSRLGGYLGLVKTVEAVSPTEVKFELKSPFAPWPRQTALVSIVCQEAYEKIGKEAFGRSPVGSGPYEFVSWSAGDAITLKRAENHVGTPGKFATVVFKPVPDETTRANSVQSGDLDVALLGPSQVPAVKAGGAVDVVDQPANRVVYLGFDGAFPFLGDEKFRKAIDLAFDRKLLSDNLLNGAVAPTAQLIAPVTFGYDPDLKPTQPDAEKAKALVNEAGYDGTPILLSYPTTGLPQVDQVAQAIAYFLDQVGIKVQLDPQEQNTYFQAWYKRDLKGLYIFAFAPSVMDANLPLEMLLKTGGQGYIHDPRIDELLAAQIGESDAEKRAELLGEISTISYDKTLYAPLFTDTYTYGVAKGLDWTPRPDGMMVFR